MNNSVDNVTATRSAQQVLDHHLDAFISGDLEGVLEDYSEDSVLIEPNATHEGIDALRVFFGGLFDGLFAPGSYDFVMDRSTVEGDLAYIVWHAKSHGADVPLGTDTFIIRDGKIAAQTFAGRMNSVLAGSTAIRP